MNTTDLNRKYESAKAALLNIGLVLLVVASLWLMGEAGMLP